MQNFKEHLLEAANGGVTKSSAKEFIKAGQYDLKGKIKKAHTDSEIIAQIEKARGWVDYTPNLKYSSTDNGFIELEAMGDGTKPEHVIEKSTFRKYKNYFIVQHRELVSIFAIGKN